MTTSRLRGLWLAGGSVALACAGTSLPLQGDPSGAGMDDGAGAGNESVGGTGGGGASFAGKGSAGRGGKGGRSASGGMSSSTGGVGGTGVSGDAGAGEPLPPFDCSAASQQFDAEHMRAYSEAPQVSAQVANALSHMDVSAKVTQLSGKPVGDRDYSDIESSLDVDVPDVGNIRGYNYRDGSRGVNLDAGQPNNRADDGKDFSTAFPAASVRAASWDLALEKRVGEAIGDETAASLNNLLLAPSMNIVRHPYWGRTQDTYGEDSYHIGRMATAFTVGLQEHVLGCATHFAANNIERARKDQDALMNEQTLREIYGRHFEMVVQDGGIGCVMASYNKINGVKSTQNKHLLREILKGPVEQGGFGFRGFVISDWWAMPGDQDAYKITDTSELRDRAFEALEAGLDVELPWSMYYAHLAEGGDSGLIDEAAGRVLRQKYRFNTALAVDTWSPTPPASSLTGGSITTNVDHEALAEEAAAKSAVLLKNGASPATAVLPLTNPTSVAVIGPDVPFELISTTVPTSCGDGGRTCTFHFATDVALGDRGANRVNADPERSVGPFDGISAAAPSGATVTQGNSVDAALDADVIVVVVGYTPGDEGEEYTFTAGGDRTSLDLPADQNDFVREALDLGKPTVIIVESGSIVNLPWLMHSNQKQATIWAGYGGLRGGAALGGLIFGAQNFSGKMPMAWPAESELSAFQDGGVSSTTTQMGYFFGYREYDRRKYVESESVDLVFPFGWGLSYSTFEYSNLTLPCQTATEGAVVDVTVDVTNTSSVDGDEVALLFVKPPANPSNTVTGERAWKELKSFARVSVEADGTTKAHLPLRIRDLRRWEGNENGHWVIDSGDYTILVGKNAEDAEAAGTQGTLHVDGD